MTYTMGSLIILIMVKRYLNQRLIGRQKKCNDIITYNHDWDKLKKGIKIGNVAYSDSRERLISIIKK